MEIRPTTRRLAEKVYPGLTARQLSSKVNEDLHRLYIDRLTEPAPIQPAPLIPFETIPAQETDRDVADRIAQNSPAIDDQNWVAIRFGISDAQTRGLWDAEAERRLTEQLNVDFDNARNEYRVQKSRITAFFARLL